MSEFTIVSIGTVKNKRSAPLDDRWGDIVSEIELHEGFDRSSLEGIDAFSHLEIIFLFHLVQDSDIQDAARHPRNNPQYPKVGIFAQRGKNRPNKLGATIVEFIKKEGNSLYVKGLDAVNGSPVVDIKPVMEEFLPDKDMVRQPCWATDLMKYYWE
ncbi:SAM-dependent methyltransferase [Bacillus sp. 1P06AnD]|uniref:SAM-dependent methyltransferase n=1 Tax=Bacillus sp. 1P06AnD TaxID=3132208 RepID=UPI0039A28A9D